ncbi:Malonyl-[acyl-carrier protein] O-methyltransferase (EC [Bathymodiolus thermophilus thioautotrophic gill symbiont]|uniref:malonyl-ACP O-methyltransferase BioC n=1 Tax=Bathymodiolus thermophilus thioautotrophic gill symbiont TaxID=2360 RepID=UPI00192AF657|nr:malonyl-ACP O-methyltransferase BioC [Bathymodiolus thermophilus thioautotrophic gill symbiont]CAB5504841.1 Malonyl-[acyl-carrier protein] O-methyltransferase (EC [Bathymodiolus thermophilus thioautotrophic gill symbiont]
MSQIRSAFNKASSRYNESAFLQKEIARRLDAKLEVIAGNTDIVLDLGAGTGLLSQPLLTRFPNSKVICLDFAQEALKKNPAKNKLCANANHLPLANNCVDIVISSLMMQWCSDLNQLFSECHRVLKNDGLILFSTFGPNTLKELKKSWAVVDNQTHVNSFTDMHDIGDQLLQNNFQSPVMEMETLTLTYQTVMDLLKDLKAIGAQTVHTRSKSLTGKNKFQSMIKMYESYRQNGKLPATYEVIYGHAWKKINEVNGITLEQR